MTDAGFSNPGE